MGRASGAEEWRSDRRREELDTWPKNAKGARQHNEAGLREGKGREGTRSPDYPDSEEPCVRDHHRDSTQRL